MTEFALVSVVFKSTLILGIVWLVTLIAGRRWPSGCTVWKRTGIVALLILPCAVVFFPTIEIPALPPAPLRNRLQLEPAPGLAEPIWIRPHAAESTPTRLSSAQAAASSVLETVDPHCEKGLDAVSITISKVPLFTGAMAVVYGCVTIIMLIRLSVAFRRIDRIRLTGSPMTDSELLRLMATWKKLLKIDRQVDVRVSDEVSIPMTFGWQAPVILVPHHCLDSSDESQKEAILVHELTHIANADFFWKVLTQLMTSMYWVHPMAWLVRRNGDILRERLCDRYCSQQLGRDTYARALIEIAKRATKSSEIGPGIGMEIAMAQLSSIRRRLDELGSPDTRPSRRSGRIEQALVVAMAAATLGLVVFGMLTVRTQNSSNAPTVAESRSAEDLELVEFWEEFHRKCSFDPSMAEAETVGTTAPAIVWPDDTEEFNAQVAATVNGIPVLNGAILDRYAGYLISVREQMLEAVNKPRHRSEKVPTIEDFQKLRKSLIQRDIGTHLQKVALVQFFKAGMTQEQFDQIEVHTDELFQREIARMKADRGLNTQEELEQALRAMGTNLSKIRDNFALDRVSMECFVARSDPPTRITEAEIQAYYESNGDEFDVPGVVWWKEYRIPRSSEASNEAFIRKLTKLSIELNQSDEENVDDVIKRFGNDPKLVHSSYNRAEAGSAVDVERGGRMFSIPLNQWSDVIEGPTSLCLIRVSNRVDTRRKPLAEVEEEIRQKLIEKQNSMRPLNLMKKIGALTQFETEYKLPRSFPTALNR